MPNITITQEVREVNITITQSGQSYTLQPVLVVNGGGGGGGAVTSVNGQIGAVLLKTDNISDADEVNKYTTQEDIDRLENTSGTNTGDQVLPTNTSDLVNDGADGINPFITANDIPADAVTSVNGEVGVVVLSTDNIADTTTNRYTNDTDITRLVNTSGTNTGDQDISGIGVNAADIDLIEAEQITQNNAIALNTAKETNATHTGDATGATALTLQPTAISGKGANVGLKGTEEVLINNAGTLEKTTTQDIANLGGGGGSTIEELINQDFRELVQFNKEYMLPSFALNGYSSNFNTTRVRANILQSGQVNSFDYPLNVVYETGTTAGTMAFLRGGLLQCYPDLKFHYLNGFYKSATVDDERFLIGLSSSFATGAPTNVEPDTVTNVIGVCKLSTSNNIHIIHNDASGTATTIDLGVNFPANDISLYYYKLEIFGKYDTSVTVKVTRIIRNVANEGEELSTSEIITTNLPTASNISAFMWVTNNATAANANLRDRGTVRYLKTY